jgi:hypothetical protein
MAGDDVAWNVRLRSPGGGIALVEEGDIVSVPRIVCSSCKDEQRLIMSISSADEHGGLPLRRVRTVMWGRTAKEPVLNIASLFKQSAISSAQAQCARRHRPAASLFKL